MRIQCPFCGGRDLSEFTVVGAASCRRPNPDEPNAQARFFEAVYLRDNPAGSHEELWYHVFGCRRWLQVTRDTRTHEVFAVAFAKETVSS